MNLHPIIAADPVVKRALQEIRKLDETSRFRSDRWAAIVREHEAAVKLQKRKAREAVEAGLDPPPQRQLREPDHEGRKDEIRSILNRREELRRRIRATVAERAHELRSEIRAEHDLAMLRVRELVGQLHAAVPELDALRSAVGFVEACAGGDGQATGGALRLQTVIDAALEERGVLPGEDGAEPRPRKVINFREEVGI